MQRATTRVAPTPRILFGRGCPCGSPGRRTERPCCNPAKWFTIYTSSAIFLVLDTSWACTSAVGVAHSSSGPGHRPLKAEIRGSNPLCATNLFFLLPPFLPLRFNLFPFCFQPIPLPSEPYPLRDSSNRFRLSYTLPMTTLSLVLVLLAAVAHSSWNLLIKRSGNKEIFVWSLLVSGSVLMAPLGVALLWLNPVQQPGWWLALATVITHTFYSILLGRGYARGDLSLVYPVARGVGPMLVPILAVLTLGEQIELPAIMGIVSIIAGIYLVSWWGRFRQIFQHPMELIRDGGFRYAVLTGLTVTIYTLVDKRGVEYVQPFLYVYLLNLGAAIGLVPYILRNHGPARVWQEWRLNPWSIVAAGVLLFIAYGLVLTAFSLSRVSYVGPAREVGIVIGVLMGVFILKEPFGLGRLLGSGFIVLGLALIALSP